jgi:hypothetical protein
VDKLNEKEDWKIVGRIPRDADNEIILQRGVTWKIEVLDIRFFRDGKPTRKGIRVNMDEAVHLKNLMEECINDYLGSEGEEIIESNNIPEW